MPRSTTGRRAVPELTWLRYNADTFPFLTDTRQPRLPSPCPGRGLELGRSCEINPAHVEAHRWQEKYVLKFVSYDYPVPAGERDLQWIYDGLPQPQR